MRRWMSDGVLWLGALMLSGCDHDRMLVGMETEEDRLVWIDANSGNVDGKESSGFEAMVALAFDAEERCLYGIDTSDDRLHMFSLGRWSEVAQVDYGAVMALAFDPRTRVLYAVDAEWNGLLEMDPETGAMTPLPQRLLPGRRVTGLACDPEADRLYAVDVQSDVLLALDPATGAETVVGEIGFGAVTSLAMCHGRLFGIQLGRDGERDRLLEIDPDSGAGRELHQLEVQQVEGLAPWRE